MSRLRSLANAIVGKTGKPDRADTATRMARDADFSRTGRAGLRKKLVAGARCANDKAPDPIEELKRIVDSPEKGEADR
jgi:hypothetical protein